MTESAPRLLYGPGARTPEPSLDVPAWAVDLRLDELAPALGAGETGLQRLAVLLVPLPDAEAVAFRAAVFEDLDRPSLAGAFRSFGDVLAGVRTTLARAARMRHAAERDRWVLDALERHDAAVEALAAALKATPPASAALRAVAAHLDALLASERFRARRADVAATRAALDGVAFRLRIGEQRVLVSAPREEADLAAEIREAFARIRDGDPEPLRVDVFDTLDMSPLDSAILARVATLAPEPFARLAQTTAAHREVVDPVLAAIAEDAAWYLAVLDVLAPLREAGLPVIPPALRDDGALAVEGLVDLVLARRLVADGRVVRASALRLEPGERTVIITGPGQGGRTSLARAIGQLHVLAAAGCPVPAASAAVPLVDRVATVFDRPERLDDPGGRLRTELRRIRSMLAAAGPRTLVIANEPFASTTAADALALARRLLGALRERGARVVAVTFLEELAADPASVSVAAAVDPADPAARTFRFERRPADGLAHAQLLAARYGLDGAAIRRRVQQ
ncbi:MAG: hypothetical protein U0838_01730 [Chloroflexota bacterium]